MGAGYLDRGQGTLKQDGLTGGVFITQCRVQRLGYSDTGWVTEGGIYWHSVWDTDTVCGKKCFGTRFACRWPSTCLLVPIST